jgi:hypothetical protein
MRIFVRTTTAVKYGIFAAESETCIRRCSYGSYESTPMEPAFLNPYSARFRNARLSLLRILAVVEGASD